MPIHACRAALGIALLAAGCTGPVRSYPVYESKAGRTAETVASAVETARLAAEASRGDRAPGRYLAEILAEAERDADAAQGTFDAIQPPDDRADELRGRLDGLLADATDGLADLRVAARRGRLGELPELSRPLAGVAERLQAFAEVHA